MPVSLQCKQSVPPLQVHTFCPPMSLHHVDESPAYGATPTPLLRNMFLSTRRCPFFSKLCLKVLLLLLVVLSSCKTPALLSIFVSLLLFLFLSCKTPAPALPVMSGLKVPSIFFRALQ